MAPLARACGTGCGRRVPGGRKGGVPTGRPERISDGRDIRTAKIPKHVSLAVAAGCLTFKPGDASPTPPPPRIARSERSHRRR